MADTSFYEQSSNTYSTALSVEIAELQKKVYLPLLPKEYPTDYVLKAYRELEGRYTTMADAYSDVTGNFYITVLFPLIQSDESTVVKYKAPSTKNIVNTDAAFSTSSYMESNYVSLTIPKHVAMEFRGYIPKGTKFIVGLIGGNSSISNIKVLAVSEKPEDYEEEALVETFGMTYAEVKSTVQSDIEEIVKEEERRETELAEEAAALEGK